MRAALDEAGVEIESAEVAWVPRAGSRSTRTRRRKLLKLIDALEDNDDVDAVNANFDVDAEVLERVMASASVRRG